MHKQSAGLNATWSNIFQLNSHTLRLPPRVNFFSDVMCETRILSKT